MGRTWYPAALAAVCLLAAGGSGCGRPGAMPATAGIRTTGESGEESGDDSGVVRRGRGLGDDAVVAIQDWLLGYLGTLLQWAGIREFKLVGFQLTPTDDPGKWQGGFWIREAGCAEDRLVNGEWFYIDNEAERAVATQMVVTRRCDGSDKSVSLMWKYGLASVDGEVPAFRLAAGAYAPDEAGACRHESRPEYRDGSLSGLTVHNLCDDQTVPFGCRDNWCSGPDLMTHIQVTADDEYTVHRGARRILYRR